MTMHTKHQVLQANLQRYLKASKPEKTAMLTEWGIVLTMHRKSMIRCLKRIQMNIPGHVVKRRGRKERYGPAVTVALKELWEMSHELCAERLHPIIAEYIRILRRDLMWNHAKDTTTLVLKMSLGTMKNRITRFRSSQRTQRNSTTKAGQLITEIPLRTGPWDHPQPGFGEIDTVVHCGDTLAGDMAYTVNYTDIATGWFESSAQMNKGQLRTQQSIAAIAGRLPFPLLGLDPDNGSEFINWHLKEWCDTHTPPIELTRSRPYKKNDNAHIEQKNGAITRQWLGYARIDTEAQVKLMNQLYAGPFRLYVNFFQPSMKCIGKQRIGSRYKRSYDAAQTPYTRILGLNSIPQTTKNELSTLYATLNPLKLKQDIDKLITQIFSRHR